MPAKILFFGFDGADPVFIDDMIAAGELPAFKRLRDASAVHDLRNDDGMGAAHFWNSAAIGAGAGHHGHYFYMQFKPDTYDIIPNHESSIPQTTQFWETLDAEGFRVAVIDWHRMQPKPLQHGLVVDNWLGHDPLTRTICFPESFAGETAKHFKGDPLAGGFACKPRETPEAMADYLFHQLNRIDAKASLCESQLTDHDWDVFVACFSDAHDIGHHYYHIEDDRDAKHDSGVAAAIPHPLKQCYRRLDAAVARILEAAGDEARVFVYGGPGMENMVSANNAMEEIARRIDLGGEAPLSTAETAKKSYRALMPRRLRWALSPLARMLRRQVSKHDFATRRFFAVPHNDNAGAIRINLKGREATGVVEPGEDYEAVIREIEDALATFRNPDTGRPLVKRVVRVQQQFDGPHIGLLPDLYVEWDREGAPRNLASVVSDRYGEIDVPAPLRTGDHNPLGFFWTPPDADSREARRPEDVAAPVLKAVRDTRRPQQAAE